MIRLAGVVVFWFMASVALTRRPGKLLGVARFAGGAQMRAGERKNRVVEIRIRPGKRVGAMAVFTVHGETGFAMVGVLRGYVIVGMAKLAFYWRIFERIALLVKMAGLAIG